MEEGDRNMTIEYKDSKRITSVSSDWTADVSSNITWSTTGKVGWDISGTTISRTGSAGWSLSKIQSTDTFTVGNGKFMIEFSGNANDDNSTQLGFNKGTLGYHHGSGTPLNNSDFAIYMAGGSQVEVYESGSKNYDSGGSRSASDRYRIEIDNDGLVKYYLQAGGTGSFVLKYTSSTTASGTYFIQANAYASTSEATVHSKTVATAVAKPSNVQDNSILVEKDTARRYWGTDKVTTEEVYDYTVAPSTSNKLTGTPTGYSADAAGVELVSSTFAGKYIKTGKWMLKRVGTLGSNAFMKVQDSSGTVKATSAGVAASGIGTSAFEYVTFTLPTAVELANGDRVYVEYTGADTSGDYLAIGEKHPSTTPTGWEFTVYNVRDVNGNNPSGVWGDDGYPTALVPTATFDLAPASNVTSDSITWNAPSKTPAEIGDLKVHYDATVGVTASSNSVSAWADQSGNGKTLSSVSNPTRVEAGQNGKDYIDFNSSKSMRASGLSEDAPRPFSMVIVINPRNTSDQSIIRWGQSPYLALYQYPVNTYYISGGSDVGLSDSTLDGSWNAFFMDFKSNADGGTLQINLDTANAVSGDIGNNGTSGSGSNSQPSTLHVGVNGTNNNWYANCRYAEIIMFDKVLTAYEKEQLYGHLKTKWGLP